AQVIMIIMAAWWSKLLGRKRYYLWSVVIFTIGSILAGTSTTFTEMLIYRVIQGFGGGGLIPISQAILRESYPPKQHGIAMAIFAMGVVLAPAMGPIVGGYLTEEYGWPWIFYVNVPFAAVGLFLVNAYVKDPPYLKRGIEKVDWGGIFLLTVGLVGLQVFLERGQEENWFESGWITLTAIVTVAALVILVFWELRNPEPIINFRVLRSVSLSAGTGVILIFGIVMFGVNFILPQFLQGLLGYTPIDAGLVLFPRGMVLFLVLPFVGRLYNYVDPRLLICVGLGLAVYSLALLSGLSLDADFWNIMTPLIFLGMGMPFVFVTLSTLSLTSVPASEATAAAGLFNLARRVGGNIGFALLATLIERRSAFHRVTLVSHISDLNETFLTYKAGLEAKLARGQVDPYTAGVKALGMIDNLVNRHATMLAYNDAYWFLVVMFAATLPLIWFLGARKNLG
ncbi:MAG: DHA2 family efflux MFS transporter permease subunit, partial [bacterium]